MMKNKNKKQQQQKVRFFKSRLTLTQDKSSPNYLFMPCYFFMARTALTRCVC